MVSDLIYIRLQILSGPIVAYNQASFHIMHCVSPEKTSLEECSSMQQLYSGIYSHVPQQKAFNITFIMVRPSREPGKYSCRQFSIPHLSPIFSFANFCCCSALRQLMLVAINSLLQFETDIISQGTGNYDNKEFWDNL